MLFWRMLEARSPLKGFTGFTIYAPTGDRDRDGARRHPIELKYLYSLKSEAVF